MKVKINVFQLGCAVLMVLVYFAVPMVYIALPALHVPIVQFTAHMFGTLVSDWLLVPLVLAVLMAVASVFDERMVSVVVGGLGFVGMLAIGLSLSAIVAGSDLTQVVAWASKTLLNFQVDVARVVDLIGSATLRLTFGFYVYLVLGLLYVLFGLLQVSDAQPRGSAGGGHPRPVKHDGGGQQRRKNMYK